MAESCDQKGGDLPQHPPPHVGAEFKFEDLPEADRTIIEEYAEKLAGKLPSGEYKLALPGRPLHKLMTEMYGEPADVVIHSVLVQRMPTKIAATYPFFDSDIVAWRKIIMNFRSSWKHTPFHVVANVTEARRDKVPARTTTQLACAGFREAADSLGRYCRGGRQPGATRVGVDSAVHP